MVSMISWIQIPSCSVPVAVALERLHQAALVCDIEVHVHVGPDCEPLGLRVRVEGYDKRDTWCSVLLSRQSSAWAHNSCAAGDGR